MEKLTPEWMRFMRRRLYLTGWLLPATMYDADLIATHLAEHHRLTRAEPGCLVFEVVRSMSDPMRYAVREIFIDRAAYDAHVERTRASEWWRVTGHICREFQISEDD